MNALPAAWMIARKDLRTFIRDKTGVALGFLLPIVLVTVFGFMMKFAFGGGEAMPRATLWVADGDNTDASRRFVQVLRNSDMLRIRPRENEDARSPDEARKLLKDGEAHHALIIEPGFGDALAAGKEPEPTLVRDPGRTMEDRIVRVGLMQGFMTVTEGRLWPASIARTMRKLGMDDAQAQSLSAAAEMMQRVIASFADTKTGGEPNAAIQTVPPRRGDHRGVETSGADKAPDNAVGSAQTVSPPSGDNREVEAPAGDKASPGTDPPFDVTDFFEDMVPLESEDITPPGRPRMLNYQLAQSVSGVAVMMLLFGMLACGSSLLQERESGTLRRLLIAAIPRGSVLGAKFLFSMIMAIIQLLVLFTFGTFVFHIGAFRDPITLTVLSLTWAAAATSFGMLIAAWAKTTKQAEGVATLLILVMAAVGGCWFPIQILDLPWFAELATQWTPTYWAMSGFQGMFWEQWSWMHPKMLLAIGVQWGFAIAAGLVALVLYKRNYVAG